MTFLMGSIPLLNCLLMICIFSIAQDPNESAKYLNLDLGVTHPSVFYNNVEASRTDSQKYLGLVLDNKLTFKKHIKDKLIKAYFSVGKIKRLCDILPRDSLVTIYKLVIRPHLDYGDVYMTNQIMIRFLIT